VNAIIFIAAHNCEKYIEKSILSLTNQSFQNFTILLIDDASTDATSSIAQEVLEQNFKGRFHLVVNDTNVGKAANAHLYLNEIQADFVVVLDGDDSIIDFSILQEYSDAYKSKYDVVWSNYQTNDGRIGSCKPLNPIGSPRSQGWRTSHLFSFRLRLFKNIPEHYFRDENGYWITSACDFAIAFPLLDQTRRYKYINKVSYEYISNNPSSHHNKNGLTKNLSSDDQQKNARLILSKKSMPLINSLEDAEIPYREHMARVEYCQCLKSGSDIKLTFTQIEEVLKQVKSQHPELATRLRTLL